MKKTFLKFKILDYYFQLIVLIAAALITLYFAATNHTTEMMWFYAIVGSVQLISFFTNWYLRGNRQSKLRLYYSRTLLVFLITCIPPITLLGLTLLLFVSPVTAIIYVYMSYVEMEELKFFS